MCPIFFDCSVHVDKKQLIGYGLMGRPVYYCFDKVDRVEVLFVWRRRVGPTTYKVNIINALDVLRCECLPKYKVQGKQ